MSTDPINNDQKTTMEPVKSEWEQFVESIIGPPNFNNPRWKTKKALFDNFRSFQIKKNKDPMKSLFLHMTADVVDNLLAPEIVGVQPILGPVAQIHTLRVKYATPPIPPSDITVEALSPFNIWRTFVGNENNCGNPTPPFAPVDTTRKMMIQILKETIEAKTSLVKDCNDNIVKFESNTPIKQVSETFADFIDRQIIDEMMRLANKNDIKFEYCPNFFTKKDGTAWMGCYDGDEDASLSLSLVLNRAANFIASKTRRGAGNFVLVSPKVLEILLNSPTAAFARFGECAPEKKHKSHVGILNNIMHVYVSEHVDGAIVGYKGPGEIDTGIYYSPYHIGVRNDDDSQLFVRAGLLSIQRTETCFSDATDYYIHVTLNEEKTIWK